ncbi:hypothetical protein ACFE04_000684 [Oxalis oulophora]
MPVGWCFLTHSCASLSSLSRTSAFMGKNGTFGANLNKEDTIRGVTDKGRCLKVATPRAACQKVPLGGHRGSAPKGPHPSVPPVGSPTPLFRMTGGFSLISHTRASLKSLSRTSVFTGRKDASDANFIIEGTTLGLTDEGRRLKMLPLGAARQVSLL